MLEFSGPAVPLTADDIAAVATDLRVDTACIHAVRDIESAGTGFLPDTRPQLLFESHAFHTLTSGLYDAPHPGISTPIWCRNYGAGGAHQYDRLAEAIALNRVAALESASWGAFQIMGLNFTACGFADVEAFVAAIVQGERAHLDAFAAFCRYDGGLDQDLRTHNWSSFAYGYNGPGQVEHYAAALSAAYARWSSLTPSASIILRLGSSGDEVRAVQQKLGIASDGFFGAITERAVISFQISRHLTPDGIVGNETRQAIIGL